MRIRITRLPPNVGRFQQDDIDLSRYLVGEVYDAGSTIGTYLIVMGFAEPGWESLMEVPIETTCHLFLTA